MKTNRKSRGGPALKTHEGAPARHIDPLAQLRRSVCSCLLWEHEFYEDGVEIADRIANLVTLCKPADVAALAIEARESFHLRHVPLLLVRELARHPQRRPDRLISTTLARVIQRADELTEFLSIYWSKRKEPLSKQVKRGLAWAFHRFDEYHLAKYNRDNVVKLRDVLFMTHPKPRDEAQSALWKKLAAGELATPDTWEVELSAGKDKRETFERLIREGKLGYLALLRNLRAMIRFNCDEALVRDAIRARKGAGRVLPFRFIMAARHAPQFEPVLDEAMQASMRELQKLPGRTFILVDNSGSMYMGLSGQSDLKRNDAAAGVAILAQGVAEDVRIFAFSDVMTEVPPRSGMALADALTRATAHGSTMLGDAVTKLNAMAYDRLIVVTDEQAHDSVPNPKGRGYMINVASNKNGVGYGDWVHIDGWSDAVVRYISEYERQGASDEHTAA